MPLDQEAVIQQQELLANYRRTLGHLLQQAAQFGGEVFAPPQTANGIAEARRYIHTIKATLRTNGVTVDDAPNDEPVSRSTAAPSPHTGGTQINAQGSQGYIGQASGPISQNFGNQTNINTGGGTYVNTGGGDYAGGNIDKRQGTFIEHSTVHDDVTGQQGVQQPVFPPPEPHQLQAPVHATEQHRTLRLFLCHSSQDKPTVRPLYRRLLADGFAPWLDEEQLLAGQDWNLEITKAVRAADVVVVCLSQSSTTKVGYVQKEIKFALDVADMQPEGTIFLIPLRLEACEVPLRLQHVHWLNLYEESGYEKLVRALSARAEKLD